MDISNIGIAGGEQFNQSKIKLASEKEGVSFKETMEKFVGDVNDMQVKADQAIEDFASGKVQNIHEVMVSMKKAELSFQFLMETSNKLVDAYKEVTRMQV